MLLQFVEMLAVEITIVRDLTSCSLIEILQSVYTKPHEDTCNKMIIFVYSLIWNS
jgi:hypothetical protein